MGENFLSLLISFAPAGHKVPLCATVLQKLALASLDLSPFLHGYLQAEQHIAIYYRVIADISLPSRVINTNYASCSKSGTAYKSFLRLPASQLANFHHPG
jgi:hypothetical protein